MSNQIILMLILLEPFDVITKVVDWADLNFWIQDFLANHDLEYHDFGTKWSYELTNVINNMELLNDV